MLKAHNSNMNWKFLYGKLVFKVAQLKTFFGKKNDSVKFPNETNFVKYLKKKWI